MTRLVLLCALLLTACGQGGGTEGAYVGGSGGGTTRPATGLR